MSAAPRGLPSRYEPLAKIASGGMATVYVGASLGAAGFVHLVAIKRPHQHLVDDPGFKEALLAEASVASSLRHANVVSVRDVEDLGESIQLIMDYVEGASLGQLLVRWSKGGTPLPSPVAVRVVLDVCAGLTALHGLADAAGRPLLFVHRDVSPQNILVGLDGVARLTDFGLAKCARASDEPTTQGTLKGKLGYIAPEYVRGQKIDLRVDVFALGVVLWEALTGRRLFRGENDADTIQRILTEPIPDVTTFAADAGAELATTLRRALERRPEARFETAAFFAAALEHATAGRLASHAEVASYVSDVFMAELTDRRVAIEARVGDLRARPAKRRPLRGPRLLALVAVSVLAATLSLASWRRRPAGAIAAKPESSARSVGAAPPPPVPAEASPPTVIDPPAPSVVPPLASSTIHRTAPPPKPPAPGWATPRHPPPNPYAH